MLVGRRARERALDCVVNDDLAGAAMAVEHLAGLGHRRIAHVSGGKGAGAADRLRGYESTMSSLGLERHVFVTPGEYTEEGGYRGTRSLLAEKVLPTAVFAANDLAALGALTALEEAGLSVPEGVSLVGYDNTYLAALGSISLTSVDQPRHEMGALAAGLLLERIESGRAEPRLEVLKPSLVARSTSSAPPPRRRRSDTPLRLCKRRAFAFGRTRRSATTSPTSAARSGVGGCVSVVRSASTTAAPALKSIPRESVQSPSSCSAFSSTTFLSASMM